jgi:hypothetical protein
VFSADAERTKPRNPDAISNRYRRMAENLGIDTHIFSTATSSARSAGPLTCALTTRPTPFA